MLLGRKLREHGHEVAFTAFHGLQGPAQGFDGFPVFGGTGEDAFARDVVPVHYRYFNADLLITLMDAWVLDPAQMQGMNVACWMPVDCDPLGVMDRGVLSSGAFRPVAMSRFGQARLEEAGFGCLYAPHSLDTTAWSPLTDRDEGRKQLGWTDKFIIGVNAANQDPFRKGFGEQLQAFAEFAERHDDALMVIHSRARTQHGADLEAIINSLGLQGRAMLGDQAAIAAGLVTEGNMVTWHGICDVLSGCSYGEGFGLPVLQSQACGIPVITTDCSAMSELCGAGWKVPGQRWWNSGHQAWWRVPFTAAIADAYEQAYGKARDPLVRDRAREFALRYDADLVYAAYWEPVLAELERPRAPKRVTGPRKVFAPVMFRDELDMLEMRLAETAGFEVGHIVVESGLTHRGVAKPLHLRENAARFAGAPLAVIAAGLDPGAEPWANEHAQRDAAWPVIDGQASDDDVVIIGDVDEIPSPSLLERACKGELPEVCAVRMRVFLHAADWEVPPGAVPPQCVVATAGYIRRHGGSLAAVRDKRETYPVAEDGGWHFSWLGGEDAARAKLETATCHTEVIGTEEGALIASGRRYRDGASAPGHLPVVPADVDETWPAWIRQRKCPPEWFRPREDAGGLDLCELSLAAAAAQSWPPGGDMAWDVGANAGQNLPLLTALYKRVIAMEPAGESFALLEASWGGHEQVEALCQAAGASDGQACLSVRAAPMQSGQLVAAGMPYYGEDHGPGSPDWGHEIGLREVPCVTLDTLMAEHGVPDFVKIDTEGGELEVLRGAAGLLARHATSWMTEFHSRDLHDACEAVFAAAGYQVRTARHWKYPEGSEMWHSHGYLRAVPGQEPDDR